MYTKIQIILGGMVLAMFGLSELSRRFPHVGWLQLFRLERPRLSEEQQARMRRRANVLGGVRLIALGLALPLIYLALTAMMFNDFSATKTTIVLTGSVLCIVLGITGIVRSYRG